jgi:hypothetical protein
LSWAILRNLWPCSSCPSFFPFSVQNICSGSPTYIFCRHQNNWQKNGNMTGQCISYKKAYDLVRRDILYNLNESGIPMKSDSVISVCV